MMNEAEVEHYIDTCLPDMPHCIHNGKNENRIAETISGLANFMKQKFREHDLKAVKKICYVAEHLYNKGGATIKIGIEKVFVNSISTIMPKNRQARRELQAIIPISLFSVYVQQTSYTNN